MKDMMLEDYLSDVVKQIFPHTEEWSNTERIKFGLGRLLQAAKIVVIDNAYKNMLGGTPEEFGEAVPEKEE